MLAPCKDCKDREIGCHSKCERYKEFVEENEKLKKHAKATTPPRLTKWSWHGYTETTGKRRRHDGKFS